MGSGPGWIPTFLYYFVATTLIGALVLTEGLESNQLPGQTSFQIALLLGLAAGGVGAYFNSYETVTLPIKNRGAFTKRLGKALTEMGYGEVNTVESVTVYERSALSRFFSGKILVELGTKNATISGRVGRMRQLKKRMEVVRL